jgi:hypothetical protein
MEMMGMSGMMRGMGGNRMGDRKIDIDYEKYKLFDGILFLQNRAFNYGNDFSCRKYFFILNKPIEAKWYLVQ